MNTTCHRPHIYCKQSVGRRLPHQWERYHATTCRRNCPLLYWHGSHPNSHCVDLRQRQMCIRASDDTRDRAARVTCELQRTSYDKTTIIMLCAVPLKTISRHPPALCNQSVGRGPQSQRERYHATTCRRKCPLVCWRVSHATSSCCDIKPLLKC